MTSAHQRSRPRSCATGDQLSASGVVSNGTDDLDITIDIGTTTVVDEARACGTADRL